jgi:hypothetical protein
MVMLLRDFGRHGIIYMTMCLAVTVATVMLLRDFGPCEIIIMNVYVDIRKATVLLTNLWPSGIILLWNAPSFLAGNFLITHTPFYITCQSLK